MSPLGISFLALAIVIGGAIGAFYLRSFLPEQHRSDETKDIVRLGTGLVGTIAALILGLLIAAAKGSYDTQRGYVQHMAADLVLLDQILAQ